MCDVFENFPVINEGVVVSASSGEDGKVNTNAECRVQNAELTDCGDGSDGVNPDIDVINSDVDVVNSDVDSDALVVNDPVEIMDDSEKVIYKDFPDSSLDVDISPVHARFIDHFLVCGNKAKAAKLAGISAESSAALRVKACRLFNRNDVQSYYKLRKAELMEKADMSFEAYMSELVSIATFDIKDAVETEVVNTLTNETVYSVHFKNIEDIPVYARKAVKSIEIAKDGTPKMVFYDKIAALKMIGEIKGYMKSSADGDEEETGVVLIPDVDFESESQEVQ